MNSTSPAIAMLRGFSRPVVLALLSTFLLAAASQAVEPTDAPPAPGAPSQVNPAVKSTGAAKSSRRRVKKKRVAKRPVATKHKTVAKPAPTDLAK